MLLELVKVAELSDGGMPAEWTKEKAKLVVEEIKKLQDFGMINLDAGDGTTITSFVRDPFGADPAAYADASTAEFEKRKQAAIEGGADPRRFYSSAEYGREPSSHIRGTAIAMFATQPSLLWILSGFTWSILSSPKRLCRTRLSSSVLFSTMPRLVRTL